MSLRNLSSATNEFGYNLYKELSAEKPDENVFFSPLSVLFALAVTLLGARGETETEMKTTMKLEPFQTNETHALFRNLMTHLQDTKDNYEFKIANKLFGEMSCNFSSEFVNECKKFYGSALESLDFKNKATESTLLINKWVENVTNHKIKDIIPSGTLNAFTKLVIANAIYFKGLWEKPFHEYETERDKFFISNKTTVEVSLMHLQKANVQYRYHKKLKCDIVELPYASQALSFVVILPDLKKGINLKKVEKLLNSSLLSKIIQNFQSKRVNIWLPKFKLELSCKLIETLKRLGIVKLFDPISVDLSKMSTKHGLYVDQLLHKAFIEVNERGSEAAAATDAAIMTKSKASETDEVIFRADHPFIFLIKDNYSGTVLFMGKLMKPS